MMSLKSGLVMALLAASCLVNQAAFAQAAARPSSLRSASIDRIQKEYEAAFAQSKSSLPEFRKHWYAMRSTAIQEDWRRLRGEGVIAACPGAEAVVKQLSETAWKVGGNLDEMERVRGQTADLLKDCKDPILQFLVGISLRAGVERSGPWEELVQAGYDFAASAEGAKLSPLVRIVMLTDGARVLLSSRDTVAHHRTQDAFRAAAMALSKTYAVRKDGDRTPGSDAWWQSRLAFHALFEGLRTNETHDGAKFALALTENIEQIPQIDPWFVAALQTYAYSELASDARGTEFAINTTGSQMLQAGDFVKRLEAAAETALQEDPTRPEALAEGIAARLTSSSDRWNNCYWACIKASSDWPPAHSRYLNFMTPRWGGRELPETAVALIRASPGSSANVVMALQAVVGLHADGFKLSAMLADPVLGPAIEDAVTRAMEYSVKESDSEGVARVAAVQLAVLATKQDWEGVSKSLKGRIPIARDIVSQLGVDMVVLARQALVFRPNPAVDEIRGKAFAAQKAGNFEQAARLFEEAAKAPGLTDSELREALLKRADGCALRASFAHGKVTPLARPGLEEFSIDYGAVFTIDGKDIQLRPGDPKVGRGTLLLDFPASESHYVLTGTLDWSKVDLSAQDERMFRVGFHTNEQTEQATIAPCGLEFVPKSKVALLWAGGRRAQAVLRLPEFTGSEVPFRIEIDHDKYTIDACGTRLYSGEMDIAAPGSVRGKFTGLRASVAGNNPVIFRDLTIQLIPPGAGAQVQPQSP